MVLKIKIIVESHTREGAQNNLYSSIFYSKKHLAKKIDGMRTRYMQTTRTFTAVGPVKSHLNLRPERDKGRGAGDNGNCEKTPNVLVTVLVT